MNHLSFWLEEHTSWHVDKRDKMDSLGYGIRICSVEVAWALKEASSLLDVGTGEGLDIAVGLASSSSSGKAKNKVMLAIILSGNSP